MNKVNFVKMQPTENIVKSVPDSAFIKVLSEPAEQYALYLHHSAIKGKDAVWGYKALVNSFTDTLALNIPGGTYQIEWTNPVTGKLFAGTKTIKHPGGTLYLTTPTFTTDIALQLKRKR